MATHYLLLIQSVSIIFQLWAVVSAIILGFHTKKIIAWLFITAAFLLMAIRRSLRFPELLAAGFCPLSAIDIAMELVALLISLLLALGITSILLLVRSLRGSQIVLEKQSFQLEKLVAERTAEYRKANEELAQYNYVISHDIRSPLRAIHNYADFLYEDLEATLDGEQKSYLNGLKSAVNEADYLVEQLLEFSRIGHKKGTAESIDLGVFLEKLILSLNLKAQAGIQMQEQWPQVQCDPLLLQQVFQNLLTNAVKFNNSQPKEVELGWRQTEGQKYEIFVRDNGIGIDARYHDRIFNGFERLHTKEEYEGTGIGLAIVKKALHAMNGHIRIESNPGRGSTFFITLPGTKEEKKNNDRK